MRLDALLHRPEYASYHSFFMENANLLRWIFSKTFYSEFNTSRILPNFDDAFKFARVPVKEIKCVVVGMDPYPTLQENGKPVATGRSFEVGGVTRWFEGYPQVSLRNILKALCYMEKGYIYDMDHLRIQQWQGNIEFTRKYPSPSEWFDAMEKQGVVFLNAALSVPENEPGAHLKAWSPFMDNLVRYIVRNNPDCKWILAGKAAQSRFEPLLDEKNIVACVHPRMPKFVAQCPFKQVPEVDWLGKNI